MVNMQRRKRIIKLSQGKKSITKFRGEERTRGRGGKAKAAVTTPTKHVPTQRTPEQIAKLSPAQKLFVEKGIVSSSIAGARKMEATFEKKRATMPAPVQGPSTKGRVSEPLPSEPLPSEPLPVKPIVASGAITPGMIDPKILAENPQFRETAAPEGFAGDVALTTGIGLMVMGGGLLLATAGLSAPLVAVAATGTTGVYRTTGLVSKIGGGLGFTKETIKQSLFVIGEELSAKASAARLTEAAGRIKGAGLLKRSVLNTAIARKTISWLWKSVRHMKHPKTVLATISATTGFYVLGKWGEVEGLEGLAWEEARAFNAGEYELADQIREVYDEAANPALWQSILSVLPILQLPETVRRVEIKLNAADAKRRVTDAARERLRTGKLTPEEQKWVDIREETKARDAMFAKIREEAQWR